MDANSHLLTLADLFSAATGKAETTIAKHAAGQAYVFQRLRDGCSITARRYNRIVQWFSDNWPADLLWPADIPRPAPSPDSPAAQARAADPANDLNANGEIANLAAWCRRNAYEPNDARSVIRRYGTGGPREGRYPRRGSAAQFVLEQLIKTGDRRFAAYHRYDRIANQAGLR